MVPESMPQEAGLFRELLDSAPDATVIVDDRATILLVNRQVENVLGYSRIELVGQPVELLVPERFRGLHSRRRDGFFRSPGTRPMGMGIELYALHKDGHEVPVEISLSPLETRDGIMVSASLRDITERRRMQAESDRMRDEVIATVSHELRTPLTSIIGCAELLTDLGEDELSVKARELIAVIDRNAARELRLVDDLLTMASLDSKRLRMSLAPVDLEQVARRVVADHGPRALDVNLDLEFEGVAIPKVMGDFYRLLQVVENLVTNALKFTPQGGTVRVRILDGGTMGVLEVVDTGVGVSAEEKAKMFQRLYRTPSAIAAQAQGVGLGLSIAHRIVEAHGGQMEVESQIGAGTVFRVSLPYAAPPQDD